MKRGPKIKHGLSYSPLYIVWYAMIKRCCDSNNKNFIEYGGRGITVCEEWKKSVTLFCEWSVTSGYKKGLTIDRINNDGNYEPSNCRFITRAEQNLNTRSNVKITYNNQTHCISEWSLITGISVVTIRNRFNNNEPLDKVFFKGKLNKRK